MSFWKIPTFISHQKTSISEPIIVNRITWCINWRRKMQNMARYDNSLHICNTSLAVKTYVTRTLRTRDQIDDNSLCQNDAVKELGDTCDFGPSWKQDLETYWYYEMISKFNVGLKSLLNICLSEPEFYDDLVYKFKKRLFVGLIFLISFKKIIIRHKRFGYNLNVMR